MSIDVGQDIKALANLTEQRDIIIVNVLIRALMALSMWPVTQSEQTRIEEKLYEAVKELAG
ncbi:hypothetical protein LCGC14_0483690 [marine sediment metagenome]|uniref:Uncharacterized protein n=1 Tax=marine sediment metagenome TaxID=412755 RepID=A0A0F9VHB4_9ZZZZ